jgi:hypothetical protein
MFAFALGLASAANPIRIWPFGDSITGMPGCWRAYLWRQLQTDGYKNIHFVGSVRGDDCGFDYDRYHDGHAGYQITDVAAGKYPFDSWLANGDPNITLIHYGTNDCMMGKSIQSQLDAFTWVLNKLRLKNPKAVVIIAKIIPISSATAEKNNEALNAQIDGWATTHTTADSPITIVDQWTGFSAATDLRDGVHPNTGGEQKMAKVWLKPTETALDKFATSKTG